MTSNDSATNNGSSSSSTETIQSAARGGASGAKDALPAPRKSSAYALLRSNNFVSSSPFVNPAPSSSTSLGKHQQRADERRENKHKMGSPAAAPEHAKSHNIALPLGSAQGSKLELDFGALKLEPHYDHAADDDGDEARTPTTIVGADAGADADAEVSAHLQHHQHHQHQRVEEMDEDEEDSYVPMHGRFPAGAPRDSFLSSDDDDDGDDERASGRGSPGKRAGGSRILPTDLTTPRARRSRMATTAAAATAAAEQPSPSKRVTWASTEEVLEFTPAGDVSSDAPRESGVFLDHTNVYAGNSNDSSSDEDASIDIRDEEEDDDAAYGLHSSGALQDAAPAFYRTTMSDNDDDDGSSSAISAASMDDMVHMVDDYILREKSQQQDGGGDADFDSSGNGIEGLDVDIDGSSARPRSFDSANGAQTYTAKREQLYRATPATSAAGGGDVASSLASLSACVPTSPPLADGYKPTPSSTTSSAAPLGGFSAFKSSFGSFAGAVSGAFNNTKPTSAAAAAVATEEQGASDSSYTSDESDRAVNDTLDDRAATPTGTNATTPTTASPGGGLNISDVHLGSLGSLAPPPSLSHTSPRDSAAGDYSLPDIPTHSPFTAFTEDDGAASSVVTLDLDPGKPVAGGASLGAWSALSRQASLVNPPGSSSEFGSTSTGATAARHNFGGLSRGRLDETLRRHQAALNAKAGTPAGYESSPDVGSVVSDGPFQSDLRRFPDPPLQANASTTAGASEDAHAIAARPAMKARAATLSTSMLPSIQGSPSSVGAPLTAELAGRMESALDRLTRENGGGADAADLTQSPDTSAILNSSIARELAPPAAAANNLPLTRRRSLSTSDANVAETSSASTKRHTVQEWSPVARQDRLELEDELGFAASALKSLDVVYNFNKVRFVALLLPMCVFADEDGSSVATARTSMRSLSRTMCEAQGSSRAASARARRGASSSASPTWCVCRPHPAQTQSLNCDSVPMHRPT